MQHNDDRFYRPVNLSISEALLDDLCETIFAGFNECLPTITAIETLARTHGNGLVSALSEPSQVAYMDMFAPGTPYLSIVASAFDDLMCHPEDQDEQSNIDLIASVNEDLEKSNVRINETKALELIPLFREIKGAKWRVFDTVKEMLPEGTAERAAAEEVYSLGEFNSWWKDDNGDEYLDLLEEYSGEQLSSVLFQADIRNNLHEFLRSLILQYQICTERELHAHWPGIFERPPASTLVEDTEEVARPLG